MQTLLSSFTTLFVILDPIGVSVLLAGMAATLPAGERRMLAWRGTLIAGGILLLFGIAGEELLRLLGISLPAFRVAGGALLFLLATDMIFARGSGIRAPTGQERVEARNSDLAVFPIAFPLIAGPGALTSIVLLMGRAGGAMEVAEVLAALAANLAITLVLLTNAMRVQQVLGVTGANVLGRLFGVILAAFAAQYVIDGVLTALAAG